MHIIDIRIAHLEDLEWLIGIYNQAIAAGKLTGHIAPVTVESQKKWFRQHTAKQYPIYVASIDGQVVGYLTLSAYRSGRQALRYTCEVSYYVHFDHHRRGVASKLIAHAIDMCPVLNIKTMFAILLDSNQGSVHLLEKYGFTKWGVMPKVADFGGEEVGHLYYGLRVYN